MQPSSRFRHIRLLIEKGELSEAHTELLLILRQLRESGYTLSDLFDKRNSFRPESSDFASQLIDLLDELIARIKVEDPGKRVEPLPKAKGGSIFSKILDHFKGRDRTSRSSSSKPNPEELETALPAQEELEEYVKGKEDDYREETSGAEPPEEIGVEEMADALPSPPSPPRKPPAQPPLIEDIPESTMPVRLDETEDIVNVSVFSPDQVKRSSRFLLTAFAHLYEQSAEVKERMREADPEASLQGAKTLNLPVTRKSQLEFRLSIEDWKIEDSVQVLTWFGIPSSVEFEVKVPEDFTGESAIGSLLVRGGNGALGRVRFNLMIGSGGGDHAGFAPTDSQNIRQALLAYAPENQAAVEVFFEEMKSQGIEVLDPWRMEGDDWEIKVSDALVESELYCLFWSKAASASTEIQASWQMALGHRLSHAKRLPDMLPVLLEQPIPEVPDELAFLNFMYNKPILKPQPNALFGNTAASTKSEAERYLMEGKEEVFEVLSNWFKADEEMLDEILMQHTRWNTLKKKLRIRLVSAEEAKTEENKIIHACLSIIGRIR